MGLISSGELGHFTGVPKSVKKRGVLDLGDLPGEESEEGLGVDLIPATMWGANCRSVLTKRQWQYISDFVRHRAGWQCEFCGAGNDFRRKKWLMAHERFEFDGDTMRLSSLICICDDCNDVTHPGHATVEGKKTMAEILGQFAEVSDISYAEARARMSEATEKFEDRSRRDWIIDLGLIGPWVEQILRHTTERG